MQKMRRHPFGEGVCVIGDGSGRRIAHVLENRVEHRPSLPRQVSHELPKFAVEVAEK